MKKWSCLILSALMLVSLFTSCAKPSDTSEETQPASDTVGETVNEETGEKLEVPDTRYDGAEMTFLVRGDGSGWWSSRSIYADKPDASSDNISRAVYERNDMILDRYGVKILQIGQTDMNQVTEVSNELAAPTGAFSAIVAWMPNQVSFMKKGYLWNLLSPDIQYIDMEKSWWDTHMAHELSINDHLFFGTGDLMTLDNDATFTMLFNKDIAKECNLPDMYQTVSDFEWTMDRMYELEQLPVHDGNNDGKLDYHNDRCGFAFTNDSFKCMVYAGGVRIAGKDDEGVFSCVLDVERADNVARKCQNIFSKDLTINMNVPFDPNVDVVGQKTFGEGHALFFGEVMQSVTRMRGLEVDFGIIPYPMYDKQQGEYRCVMHGTGTAVSIPVTVSENSKNSLTMVESIIEAMSYLAQSTVTKEYYEVNLKTKDSKDPESGPMMDMILAHRVFDPAYYYGWANAEANMTSFARDGKVGSNAKRIITQCNRDIGKMLEQLERNDAKLG